MRLTKYLFADSKQKIPFADSKQKIPVRDTRGLAFYTKRQNYFAVFRSYAAWARRISLELPAHVSMMHSISATGRNLTDVAAHSRACQSLK